MHGLTMNILTIIEMCISMLHLNGLFLGATFIFLTITTAYCLLYIPHTKYRSKQSKAETQTDRCSYNSASVSTCTKLLFSYFLIFLLPSSIVRLLSTMVQRSRPCSVLRSFKLCHLSQATVAALAKLLLISIWILQTASANLLYHRLALTTLFFKAIITLLGWIMS